MKIPHHWFQRYLRCVEWPNNFWGRGGWFQYPPLFFVWLLRWWQKSGHCTWFASSDGGFCIGQESASWGLWRGGRIFLFFFCSSRLRNHLSYPPWTSDRACSIRGSSFPKRFCFIWLETHTFWFGGILVSKSLTMVLPFLQFSSS